MPEGLSEQISRTRKSTISGVPAINLSEIPEAHISSGKQDTFELSSAELLTLMGYEVVEPPGRGPDLGKDFVVVERRKGIGRETKVRWLVSCKHKAHSGTAVGLGDEQNIVERVEGHKCLGFFGVYSTLASSSLHDRLRSLEAKFESQVLDSSLIEKELLKPKHGLHLAKRYFPVSAAKWGTENPVPANIFRTKPSILCDVCSRDLLDPPQGIISFWRTSDIGSESPKQYVDLYWSCKGTCDRAISEDVNNRYEGTLVDGWESIEDFCIPRIYLEKLVVLIEGLQGKEQWSPTAFDKLRRFFIALYPHVARHATHAEDEWIESLAELPPFLSGLGLPG